MHDEMTVDDAINVARVVGDFRDHDDDREVRELAIAARRLAPRLRNNHRNSNARERGGRALEVETYACPTARRSLTVWMAAAVGTF